MKRENHNIRSDIEFYLNRINHISGNPGSLVCRHTTKYVFRKYIKLNMFLEKY